MRYKGMDEYLLKSFGDIISSLMAGEDLSRETARDMFSDILRGIQPDLHQGACLAALRMKGETAEEIAGCFEAIYEMDTNRVDLGDLPIVENCGTGMDSLKTFNISTLAAVVAASKGVFMARHGSRAITSRCGTVDLCEAIGIDVECAVDLVKESIKKCGLGLFNGMSSNVHPGGLGRILSQIRFGSTLNIAASLANPALPRVAVRGVGAPDQIEPTLNVMEKIGYQKAIIFHGLDRKGLKGMDELSTIGTSHVGFLNKGRNPEYVSLRPEEFGITNGNYEDIKPLDSIEDEAIEAVRLLSGRGNRARTDIVSLNAGAILWVAGKVRDLKEGLNAARDEMATGRPLKKLVDWVKTQNRYPEVGLKKITALCGKGGILL